MPVTSVLLNPFHSRGARVRRHRASGSWFEDACCGLVPYVVPVLAGAGVSTMLSLSAVDWSRATSQATGAMALAGLVGGGIVGGIVYAVNKYDQIKIERQKKYDDANKTSLTAQIERLTAESLSNQEKMRESLHVLRNEAQLAKGENHLLRDDLATLRAQFMDVSKALRETDAALHLAHEEMRKMRVQLQETSDLLAATAKDRDALRVQMADLLRRVGAIEEAGGPTPDHAPAPPIVIPPGSEKR